MLTKRLSIKKKTLNVIHFLRRSFYVLFVFYSIHLSSLSSFTTRGDSYVSEEWPLYLRYCGYCIDLRHCIVGTVLQGVVFWDTVSWVLYSEHCIMNNLFGTLCRGHYIRGAAFASLFDT